MNEMFLLKIIWEKLLSQKKYSNTIVYVYNIIIYCNYYTYQIIILIKL